MRVSKDGHEVSLSPRARSRNVVVRCSYAAGWVRSPPVWPASGSSQSCVVGPPALAVGPVGGDLVRRADAAGDQQHRAGRDARHEPDQRRRLAHARDGADGLEPDRAEGALGKRRVADALAVHRPRGAVGDDRAQPAVAGGGLEQHLGAERGAEAGDALRVDVGPPAQPAQGGVDGRLGVVAESVRVARRSRRCRGCRAPARRSRGGRACGRARRRARGCRPTRG